MPPEHLTAASHSAGNSDRTSAPWQARSMPALAAIRNHHERLDFRRAAAETRALWVVANAFLQRAAPWSASADRAAVTTRVALNLVRLCATAAHSIIPSLSCIVLGAFGD